MRERRNQVIDRYNAARLLRRFEIAGITLGALAFIVGTALTALASPHDEDPWNATTGMVAGILILAGPVMALWILFTLQDGEQ
jgi:hypothetical protein